MAEREVEAIVTQERHVILVGKTGSGKSTIGNQLLDNKSFKVSSSLLGGTSKVEQAVANIIHEQKRYKMVVIDTVGLFDTSGNNNKQIIKQTKESIEKYAPHGINLMIFVFKQSRFTKEEEETFRYIADNFGKNIREVAAMVITNCESKGIQAREAIIEEFKTSSGTKQFATLMGKGIYTVGFPNVEDMDEDDQEFMEKKIKRDQATLHNLVMQAGTKRLRDEIDNEAWWEKIPCKIL